MNMKKVTALFLTGVLCCSFVACNGDSGNQSSSVEEPVVETEHYLVKDGKSSYTILLPENASNSEILCASEINTFLAEATGLTLPIVYEGEGTADVDKMISIGRTTKLAAADVTVDYKALGTSGYVIKTIEDDVYMTGNEWGMVYSAYEFLEKHFNYYYYTDNVYEINTGVKEKKLVDFDKTDIPAFDFRLATHGFQNYANKDSMCTYRMRLNEFSPRAVGGGGGSWHNFFHAIPKAKYQEAHENWYSPDGTQLCLTRDRVGLATEMKNIIIQQMEEDPSLNYIHIGQEDTNTWCDCSACKAEITKYGNYNVVTYMLFVNKVSELLQPYLDEHDRELNLTMFAYHKTQEAPVTYDEKLGDYKIISNDLKLRDNVYVLYAPIEADYYEPFTSSVNANTYRDFKGWSLLSNKLFLWTYLEHFQYYFYPMDNFNSMQQNFQLARDLGVTWYYNQGQWNNYNSSGFSHLKAYLSARLEWNPDLNVRDLTKKFCDYYYGEASDIMMSILDDYKTWRAYTYYELGHGGGLKQYPTEAKHWPFAKVTKWLAQIDEAYELVEKYNGVNDQKYKRLHNAIALDSLSFRYVMITHYNDEEHFTDEEMLQMKKDFKKDAMLLNVTLWKEHAAGGGDMNTLYKAWGIA